MSEEPVLTDEEYIRVEEGDAARLLLDSPMFLTAIERIRNQCADGILTSKPDQSAAREDLYNLSRGLSAVTQELLTIASIADTILENATRPTDEDVQEHEAPDTPSDY